MSNEIKDQNTIDIEGKAIDKIESYIYLRESVSLNKRNRKIEIDRRILLGWATYVKSKKILNSEKPMKFRMHPPRYNLWR